MKSNSLRLVLVVVSILSFVSTLASCETQEETGVLTARELRTKGAGSTVLNGSTITLSDAQGHKAVLTPTSLRFLSVEGKVVAEYSPTAE
jgi:hypothetical protein